MKTVKEILVHAMTLDYANRYTDKTIFLNIPKNNDYSEVLDAVSELLQSSSKKKILFIATNSMGYNIAKRKGYDAVVLQNIIDYDINNGIQFNTHFGNYNYIILQSIDGGASSIRICEALERSVGLSTILIYCYDSSIVKKFIPDNVLSNSAWRFTKYCVKKITRAKPETSLTLYNIRNNIRQKVFNLDKFIDEQLSTDGSFNIHKTSELDIEQFVNPNVPIITPHKLYVKNLNREIRSYLRYDKESDYIPIEGEWLVMHEPGRALVSTTKKYLALPVGYRFQVKSIYIPAEYEEEVATVVFDHYDVVTKETYECSINISLAYIEYLINDVTIKKIPQGCYMVYFGYVIGNWQTIDQTYSKGVAIYNRRWMYSKDELYTTIVPIQEELDLIIIR